MKTVVRIRQSRPDDGPRVVQLWRGAVAATHGFVSGDDLAAIGAQVEEYLPLAPLWLAVNEKDFALGFMGLTGAHMDALFIDPAWHGRGIGRQLVAHAAAMHSGLTTDVNEQNLAALTFYEGLGFVRAGRSPLDDQGRPYPLIHLRLAPACAR